MRLGVAYAPYLLNVSWRTLLDMANKVGVTTIEVRSDDPKLSRRVLVDRFKDLLSSYDFDLGVHAPYIDINPASLNPLISRITRRVLLHCVNLAQTLEANYIVIHPGEFPIDYPRMLRRRAINNLINTIYSLSRTAKDSNIEVLIENTPKDDGLYIGSTIEEIKDIATRLECKLALDLGHANTMGNPLDYINELAPLAAIIHIHDNNGERDEHLPLGRGTLKVPACLYTLSRKKYNGPLVVQTRGIQGLINSVRVLRNIMTKTRISTT